MLHISIDHRVAVNTQGNFPSNLSPTFVAQVARDIALCNIPKVSLLVLLIPTVAARKFWYVTLGNVSCNKSAKLYQRNCLICNSTLNNFHETFASRVHRRIFYFFNFLTHIRECHNIYAFQLTFHSLKQNITAQTIMR